jgi:hypothetical protein
VTTSLAQRQDDLIRFVRKRCTAIYIPGNGVYSWGNHVAQADFHRHPLGSRVCSGLERYCDSRGQDDCPRRGSFTAFLFIDAPTAVRRSSTRGTSHPSPICCAFTPLMRHEAADSTVRPGPGWTSGGLFDPNTGEFLGNKTHSMRES